MKKNRILFILAVCITLNAQQLDMREGDDGSRPNEVSTRIGIGTSPGCCNASCFSSCDKDIIDNYQVMSDRISENMGYLNNSWNAVLQSFITLRKAHNPMTISTLTKGRDINHESLDAQKRLSLVENYQKVLQVATELEILGAEVELMKAETSVINASYLTQKMVDK